MSAFILSNKHITAMLQGIDYIPVQNEAGEWEMACTEELGQTLKVENYRSVNYRYGEDSQVPEFKMEYTRRYSPAELLKAVRCYQYQSCEHPGWRDSQAHHIANALLAKHISNLTGYDEAEWGIAS